MIFLWTMVDKQKLTWRVYYGDGTSFDSSDGRPAEAPGRNVQVIVMPDERTGRYLQCMHDFYVWRGRWVGVDQYGLWDYLADPGWARVLFGRTIEHDTFSRIYQDAKRDPDFPQKSGRLPKERGPR